MNNSKKDESLVEIGSLLAVNVANLDSLRASKDNCENNLYNSMEEGVYKTFNFKMKEIHKYSTGLVSILFIQIGLFIIIFIWGFLLLMMTSSAKGWGSIFGTLYIFYLILSQIAAILNLVFFILLSVYYYKGKIDEFKDFRECNFFDEANFNKTYEYIFLVYKNCKRVFIVDLILLCVNYGSLLILLILIIFCD